MTTTVLDAGPSALNIGEVVGAASAFLRKRLPGLLAWTAGLITLPWVVTGLPGLSSLSGASGLVISIPSLIFQSMVCVVFVADASGETLTFRSAFDRLGGRLRSLYWLTVIAQLGIILAALLVIVPGVFLAVMWTVAIPVSAVERLNAVPALERSQKLTKGSRLPVFGLFAMFFVTGAVLFTGVILLSVMVDGTELLVDMALLPLTASVLNLVGSIGMASIYVQLRTAKEGLLGSQVAEVFS